ncbi:MAG: stage II sporulation protein R [Clostridia bacterium]|nr:stage II sporulation protein R [Clostridia bacterium]
MKKIALVILASLLLTTSIVGYSEELSEELSEGIVRVHIIANSNSPADQAVKIKVRDEVLKAMESFATKEEVGANLDLFEQIADSVLGEEGFEYQSRAEMGMFDFPTKHYDGFSLPKGRYNAVRIKLGDAEGDNWWCVLFPPLCMVEGATEQEELLRETFGENYDVISQEGSLPVRIKFKIAELF